MKLLVLSTTIAALAIGGCGGGDSVATKRPTGSGRGVTVNVKTFDFRPDPLTVKAGTTVTFVNHDAINHTVTSGTRKHPDGRFDEKLAPAVNGRTTTATVRFAKAGRYRYFCAIHPGAGMTAEVIVR